jgi:hypothetical protein
MQIHLDINDNVAEALRALGLAIEDPVGVIDKEAEIEEMRADLEKAAMEIDEAKAEIKRLRAQHDTDTRLIEGLREQLSKKDSPAPAPALVPPVQAGQASEDVLKLQPRAESPQGAEDGAGPHSAVLRVPAPAGATAGGVAPVLRAGEGADGPGPAGARAAQPGEDGGAAQAPGGEGRRGEGGAGDVAENGSHEEPGADGKQVAGDEGHRTTREDPEAPGEEQDREAGAGRLAGNGSGNGGPPTVPAAANDPRLPDDVDAANALAAEGERLASTAQRSAAAAQRILDKAEQGISNGAGETMVSNGAPNPAAAGSSPARPASLRWGRIGPPETGAWHLWASAQDGEAACEETIGPETEIVFVAEDESIPLEQMCQDCIGIESRQSAPAPATPSKNGKGICARCNGKETKRTVPTSLGSTAPEYLRPFAGKHLCADCETELRKPRCKGKKADSSPCTARPKANGYCGRHHGQVPAAQEATG